MFGIFSTMWALTLLLAAALFSVTVADKAEVQRWTEVVRQAANRLALDPDNYKLDADKALQGVENVSLTV